MGDPMVSYLQRKTRPEMLAYAHSKELTVPQNLLR